MNMKVFYLQRRQVISKIYKNNRFAKILNDLNTTLQNIYLPFNCIGFLALIFCKTKIL